MTAITGYKCDICGKFTTDRTGHMKLDTYVSDGVRPDSGFTDICSNRCLLNLATERLRDIDGEEPQARPKRGRPSHYSDEEKKLILERAEEVGLAPACKEFGIAYSTAARWGK